MDVEDLRHILGWRSRGLRKRSTRKEGANVNQRKFQPESFAVFKLADSLPEEA